MWNDCIPMFFLNEKHWTLAKSQCFFVALIADFAWLFIAYFRSWLDGFLCLVIAW